MSASEHDKLRHQSFYGPGSVGGDNKGTINNNVLLDPQTKAYLAYMSIKAPELASLLRRSLSEGFISPDTAQALIFAARNINEDVATSLMIAGRNINEDVATSLEMAGRNINEDVAHKLDQVKEELNETASGLDSTVSSLREILYEIRSVRRVSASDYQLQHASADRVTIRPSSQNASERWLRVGLTCFSLGVGLIAARILLLFHQAEYTTVAGVFAVIVPVTIFWIAKARR